MKKRHHKLYGKRLKNHLQALVRMEIFAACGDDQIKAYAYCANKIDGIITDYNRGIQQLMINTALKNLNNTDNSSNHE